MPFKPALIGSQVKFMIAEDLYDDVKKQYGDVAEIETWGDTLKLEHMFIAAGIHRATWTYGYFVDGVLILPECTKPRTTLKEYKPKASIVLCSRQSHNQILEPFSNNDPDIDYFVDNKVWNPYRRNVIPKRIHADIRVDILKYFAEKGGRCMYNTPPESPRKGLERRVCMHKGTLLRKIGGVK